MRFFPLLLCCLGVSAAEPAKPNILFIVADDIGIGDVGFSGGKEFPTPNIDRVAREGVVFEQGYVTGPVCSPSRAGMITGRYQQRFGHEFNPSNGNVKQQGLALGEVTLPQRLRDAGYRTAIVGKWHLGNTPEFEPLKRGFDEQPLGFLGGAHSYVEAGKGPGQTLLKDGKPTESKGYLTDAFADVGADFIGRNRGHPWYLYAAFNAAHTPLQAKAEKLALVGHIQDPQRRRLAAMMLSLDEAVGRLLKALEDSGQAGNTLVVFLSDNGGQTHAGASNLGLRGYKGTTWEGGVRSPIAARWPARIKPGTRCAAPTSSLDVTATFMDVASGAVPKEFDGRSLVPAFAQPDSLDAQRPLYWRFGSQFAVRVGDWKLVRAEKNLEAQLFNLAADPAEKVDLASSEKERTARMRDLYEAWAKTLARPAWRAGPQDSDGDPGEGPAKKAAK